MGCTVEAEWKLQDVLEESREHRLAALMCQPVGEKRDERATNNHEEAKAYPGCDQWQEARPG